MNTTIKVKQTLLLLGDLVMLYASLALTLIIRYQQSPNSQLWQSHIQQFSLVFFIWFLIFYIADLYNIHTLKNSFEFNQKWGIISVINLIIAVAIFYFLPSQTGLSPKTNLLLFSLVFGIIGFSWRRFYNIFLRHGEAGYKMLLIGHNAIAQEIVECINQNPQLSYELKLWLKEGLNDPEFNRLSEVISREKINLIIVPAQVKKNREAAKKIYQNLVLGIEVIDLATLYSLIFEKTPLSELEEIWFLENITKKNKVYDAIKRPFEFALAIVLFLIFLLPGLLIVALIKITSWGPALIKQVRIGKRGQLFNLYKFRSMHADAEKSGPQWSGENDTRITPLGLILRRTHLDELPQLINIINGDLSFVGPRPERPEFVQKLNKMIPYYDLRHLVRPGLTGWAQLQYRYGSSVEDAYQKLQYDIYYLKNYSFWLDLSILLKTIRLFFTKNE